VMLWVTKTALQKARTAGVYSIWLPPKL